MKAGFLLLLLGSALNLFAQSQSPVAASSPPVVISPYAVTQRGPHHRLWQQVTAQTNLSGQTIYRTNSYQELGTGICYWNGTQWSDSTDQIQLTPNGAAASNAQHRVSFAANINTAGAINLTTPDGQQMTSQILGLAYTDAGTGSNVLFAETQDSIGLLLPSGNKIIYTNAFTNVDCDVLYSQKLSGFEQDKAAWLLGCQPHDVPILVASKLLKPLGNPPANGIKFFAAADILELAKDRSWLARITNTVSQHWQKKNARKKSHSENAIEDEHSSPLDLPIASVCH